jgi:hypothetical protein
MVSVGVFLGLGLLGALIGDDGAEGGAAGGSQQTAASGVADAPDVVGMALDEAIEHLEALGLTVEASDAVEDRAIMVRANWSVVSQEQDGGTVRLGVNKTRESSPEPEPVDDAADVGSRDDERVSRIGARVLAMYEAETFVEVLTNDPEEWPGYVADIRIESSRLHITLQIAGEDDSDRQLAEYAANTMLVIGDDLTDGLSWVVVENGAGTKVVQKQFR